MSVVNWSPGHLLDKFQYHITDLTMKNREKRQQTQDKSCNHMTDNSE